MLPCIILQYKCSLFSNGLEDDFPFLKYFFKFVYKNAKSQNFYKLARLSLYSNKWEKGPFW